MPDFHFPLLIKKNGCYAVWEQEEILDGAKEFISQTKEHGSSVWLQSFYLKSGLLIAKMQIRLGTWQ